MFDKDGDGTINSSELKTVMKTAGLHPSDGDVTKLIKVSVGSGSEFFGFGFAFWAKFGFGFDRVCKF